MKDFRFKDINDTIDQIFSDAIRQGIFHLYTEDNELQGNNIQIKGQMLINFGSCSYLGLELDERIKKGVIDAVNKWGTQYSSSRSYISVTPYFELEELISQIFDAHIVITTSTSSGHISAIPTIVSSDDAVILDHQVHASVQTAVQLTRLKGTVIDLIRHSRLDQLEEKIQRLRVKHRRIWYMIDGVYSMFGDFAPIHALQDLLNKYEQFHLYIDDAHGMSWTGKHGRGYTLSQVSLHPKMVIATSFAKGFGTGGGALIFPNKELARRVKTCGGPLIFSGPMQPPMLGGTIASAKIHLSPEIYSLQNELKEKIEWTHKLLNEAGLPVLSSSASPIFFIGMGLPKVGNNIVKRLFKDGFYVNLAVFPGVPIKNTGIRFTITRHITLNNIKNLVDAIKYHMKYVYEEENTSDNAIRHLFNLPSNYEEKPICKKDEWKIEHSKSIKEINKEEWNKYIGEESFLDWHHLSFVEEVYSNNINKDLNSNFHYYIVRDGNDLPVLMTFFTSFLSKEDIFSPAEVSRKIEDARKNNPDYLISRIFMMGTLVSVGNHMYLDKSNERWKEFFELLLKRISEDQEKEKAFTLCLRDFDENDIELKNFLLEHGLVEYKLPDTHVLDIDFDSTDSYLKSLKHDKRHLIKKRVLEYEKYFQIEIVSNLSPKEVEECYALYKNVAEKSFEINVFDLPKKFFYNINNSGKLEVILIKLKPDYIERKEPLLVGIAVNYKSTTSYSFILTGMDYNFVQSHSIYYQILWQIIKRAINLKAKKINMGLTASQNKRKFNALNIRQVAYIQANDNFNMELIGLFSAEKK